MPDVERAQIYLPDAEAALQRAEAALQRAMAAWNPTQMRDALRSLRTFINKAEAVLPAEDKKEGV